MYSIGSGTTGTRAGIYFPATLTGASVGNENAGIHINNCPSATISNNTIERTNYTATAPAPLAANQFNLQFGISVGNSCTGAVVSNNLLKLLGTGIYAFGNTPITLKCNNMVNNSTGLWINSLIGNQGTVSAPQDNTWTIPSGYMGVRRNGQSQPQFYTRSFSLPYMPSTSSSQMIPPAAIQPTSAANSAPNTCYISAGNPPAGLVQVINEEGEYSYLSDEELKSLDVDLYKTLKIIPDYIDESTFEGQKMQEFIDSVDLTNAAKIYEYEQKLAQKDTIGAKELMALFDAYSDVEYNYKRVYEIYNRSWLEKEIEFTAEDSLVLNEIAYLSPRVAGNAVYTARVLLGLMIIDTETYAAKSAQSNSGIEYSTIKIYPNPSSEFFHYELPLKEGENGIVSIMDISGKVLQTWAVDFNGNLGSFYVQNYSKGVYVFELTINNDQKIVQKLIVK
ncbi:MAG: T9SS C-terminal target domain-containing protein [Crocinitomicaceae bacterium]|nr:T9SS C-terminal target domain-containing protein [Crocinitomicaceae bacterium]